MSTKHSLPSKENMPVKCIVPYKIVLAKTPPATPAVVNMPVGSKVLHVDLVEDCIVLHVEQVMNIAETQRAFILLPTGFPFHANKKIRYVDSISFNDPEGNRNAIHVYEIESNLLLPPSVGGMQ